MKKICFINVNAYSIFNPRSKAVVGGTEVQLFNIANYLSFGNNFQISFIVGDWGQKVDEEYYGKIKLVKSFSLQKTLWNYVKAPFVLWNKLTKEDADVYIASSAGVEIGIIALFCKMKGRRFIYRTAHQIDCNLEFIKERGIVGKIYKYGLENTDVVITQNKEHQEMLWNNHKIDAIILKNCYNIKMTNKQDKKYILWVARCDKWKRPKLFLRIVKNFSQEKFIMISPRVEHNKQLFVEIEKEARQLNNLQFIEKVPFSKIQEYFNKAKLFIGTSDYEGFPNTYLQACMGGTPIISLRVNPDKFITKNSLGYCADGNFNLMLKQIKQILKNKDDWKVKSDNTLEYVKKNHDINNIGKRWEKIINKLV